MEEIERIAKSIEMILLNVDHDDLINAIARSNLTVDGIVESIDNNVYPVTGAMRSCLVECIKLAKNN